MSRELSGVPRNQLEALIHELDRKVDRAELLRDQAVTMCERRTKERDMWRREAHIVGEGLVEAKHTIYLALVELRAPALLEDVVEKAIEVLS